MSECRLNIYPPTPPLPALSLPVPIPAVVPTQHTTRTVQCNRQKRHWVVVTLHLHPPPFSSCFCGFCARAPSSGRLGGEASRPLSQQLLRIYPPPSFYNFYFSSSSSSGLRLLLFLFPFLLALPLSGSTLTMTRRRVSMNSCVTLSLMLWGS